MKVCSSLLLRLQELLKTSSLCVQEFEFLLAASLIDFLVFGLSSLNGLDFTLQLDDLVLLQSLAVLQLSDAALLLRLAMLSLQLLSHGKCNR